MPAASRKDDMCSGDGGFPPTPMQTPIQGTVYANGKLLGVRGTPYPDHSDGHSVHTGRKITGGSGTVSAEGKAAARIQDAISDGAVIAQGSSNVNIG